MQPLPDLLKSSVPRRVHQLALRMHQVGLERLLRIVAVVEVRVEGQRAQVQHAHGDPRGLGAALVALGEGMHEAVLGGVTEDEE